MSDSPRPDAPRGVSRRRFVGGTLGAGAGAAAVWSVPSLRTVRPLQAAGSPPPPTTVETPVTAAGVPTSTSTTTLPARAQGGPTPASDPGNPVELSSGRLPITGTEALELAAFGTAAVAAGRALMAYRGRDTPPVDDKYASSGDDES